MADTQKLTSLEQLKLLAQRTGTEVQEINTKIEDIEKAGGEANVITAIAVNGAAQEVTDKTVNIAVPTKTGELTNDAGFQTAAEVGTAIQTAISATGHAHFEKADTVPTAEEAQENVLYLVMNDDTGHYDIYALVSGEVVLIDDATVDLTAYSTTEQMNEAIAEAKTTVEASETNGNIKVNGAEVVVYTLPDTVLQESNMATDEEVNAMLDEAFGTTTA